MHREIWQRDGQASTDLIVTHADFRLRKKQRGLQRVHDTARRCVPSLREKQSVSLARLRFSLSWPTAIARRPANPVLDEIDTIASALKRRSKRPSSGLPVLRIAVAAYDNLPRLTEADQTGTAARGLLIIRSTV
jgi:hypothetical protein